MRNIARRLLQLVLVVVLSTLFTFSLLRLFPGDIADAVLPLGTKAQKQQFVEDNGLDKPFFEQYATWLGNLVQGDLGKDYQSNTPVIDKLEAALPVSLQLMLYAQILALLVAIPLGVLTAYRANTKTDRSINAGAFALAGAAELRARARARVLRRGEVATRHTPPRPDPGDGLRTGLARAALRPTERRPRPALRHAAAPGDLPRRRAWSRCTCGCSAAT